MVQTLRDCSGMYVTLLRARFLLRDFACEIKTLHNVLWFCNNSGFIKTRYIGTGPCGRAVQGVDPRPLG